MNFYSIIDVVKSTLADILLEDDNFLNYTSFKIGLGKLNRTTLNIISIS